MDCLKILIGTALVSVSCATTDQRNTETTDASQSTTGQNDEFRGFVKLLPKITLPFETYCDNCCDRTEINDEHELVRKYAPEGSHIVGLLEESAERVIVLVTYPGDMLVPSVNIYGPDGKVKASKNLLTDYCGGDEGYYARAFLRINPDLTMNVVDTSYYFNDIDTTRIEIKHTTFMINEEGNIVEADKKYRNDVDTVAFQKENVRNLAEKRRRQIAEILRTHEERLIVLVKVAGETSLRRVIDKNWPDEIETTYNILKDAQGRVIYIGEFPTSQSGDWTLALQHYFADDQKLVAFEKTLSYFNEDCSEGVIKENEIELYDSNFHVIETSRKISDIHGKSLKEETCGNAYDWTFDKRATASELMKLKNIQL